MKDLYFSHDRNSLTDDAILDMRAMYGMEGYGVFWAIIEALSRQPEMKLPFTELKLKSLTASFRQTFDLKQYIEDCAQLGLFRIEAGCFFSESLIRRSMETAQAASEKSEKRRRAANKRWGRGAAEKAAPGHGQGDANASSGHDSCNALASDLHMQVHPVCNTNADGFASQNKNINSSSCSSRACAREDEGAADPFNPQIDPEWKKVYDAYEANIGPMPMGRSLELLTSYVEDMGAEVVVYAIELTNEAQPAAPAKFLRTVLEAFAQGGVRTLAEAQAQNARHRSKMAGMYSKAQPSPSQPPPGQPSPGQPSPRPQLPPEFV